uniref:Calcium-transporting ATPase n=1 Tax=Pinguiococcus pyrenoidosus TaxID=172671 RepID=A0A7R9U9C9_9STRA|mmetsp:Transcript_19943/g.75337  ORF Transcript_19943/g.75337 Transcript_19943/m.75337 type:complete len:928 (+) Transcript_19943:202-2985(+)
METASASQMMPEEVLHAMDVIASEGLSSERVFQLRDRHGRNEMEKEPEETLVQKFFGQFKDPMILLLLASAGVSLLLRQFDDAISITLAVIIVSTVAFVQEYRSEQALAALEDLVPPRTNVLRSGVVINVEAKDVVPGDIFELVSGDLVAADARVISSNGLMTDESSLTGESNPCTKKADRIDVLTKSGEKVAIAECSNMVFMGTLVTAGNARAVVTATGMQTEFGTTFAELRDMEDPKTPLQLKMDELGKSLSIMSFGVIGLISLIGYLRGRSLLSMFQIGVSLAVAAIPEGLPICVTVTLALGVIRMAKRKAIVKKLPAVEALGCTNAICVDKTGTLTQNRQVVTEIFLPSERAKIDVTGVGYHLEGTLTLENAPITAERHGGLRRLLEAAYLCNNAQLKGAAKGGEPGVIGQSTEGAILVVATKAGMTDPRLRWQRIKEEPFSSEKKKMMVSCRTSNSFGESVVEHFMKGAPDFILEKCTHFVSLSGEPRRMDAGSTSEISSIAKEMGSRGLRVLAVARGVEVSRLEFVGLLGMRDPPKSGVKEAVEVMRKSGVRVIMVTGDAYETAISIGSDLKIYDGDASGHRAVSGGELEGMSEVEREQLMRDVTIFYRLSPRHKRLIVKALQTTGHVVGMTGDGVNDSSALKAAEIGVAMGLHGTEVAKEAADMVLLDDNFSTILPAVEEGKAIYYNIKNFLTFQLSTSVAALSLISFSTLFGYANPLNAMQILWINIIMDGPPAQSLGVEPVDEMVRKRPPRDLREPIVTSKLLFRVLTTALLVVAGTLHVFLTEYAEDQQVTNRETTMTFTVFVAFDMVNAYCCRSESKPFWQLPVFGNHMFLGAVGFSVLGQLAVIYVPFFQRIFQTEALTMGDLLYVCSIASLLLLLDAVRKIMQRRYDSTSGGTGSNSGLALLGGPRVKVAADLV